MSDETVKTEAASTEVVGDGKAIARFSGGLAPVNVSGRAEDLKFILGDPRDCVQVKAGEIPVLSRHLSI